MAFFLPLLQLLHSGLNPTGPSLAVSGVAGSSSSALFQLDARWGLAIAGLWAVASLIRIANLAVHSLRLRRLWKSGQAVEVSENLLAALREIRGGRVEICTTQMLDRPGVIGFFTPRILIPDWLIARATPGELEQIILHEAEHLRRSDDWSNLLQKICLVAFPLNPGLAWIERRLCREREIACDEGVVRITNAPRAYAACLASLAEHGLERRAEALSLGAWHRRSELVNRVYRILRHKQGVSRTAGGALLGAVGCMLIAGSIEMARCPQMIAFVPRPNGLAMTPERQQQLAAMLARDDAESRMMVTPGFHAVQARAVMPPARQSTPAIANGHKAKKALQESREKSDARGAEQIAVADRSGDRVSRESNPQWVVLAAWEEVQTVSRLPQSVADYEPATDADSVVRESQSTAIRTRAETEKARSNSDIAPNADGSADQYTIRRLILRVVPANSNPSQPATQLTHGGWLVFQL